MKVLAMLLIGLVVLGARSGATPGGPPTAATEIPTSGGHGALFGVLVVVGLLALVAKTGGGNRSGPRTSAPAPVLRTKGYTRAEVVRHERAHVRAIRRSGAGRGTFRVRKRNGSWEGVTTIVGSTAKWEALPIESKIGVYAAGEHGSPHTPSAPDRAAIDALAAGQPRRVRRRGEALGRRWAR